MAVRLFITGGTIDGFDCSDPGRPSLYPQSHISELLRRARLNEPVAAETVVFKDGRSITDSDRRLLLRRCQNAKEAKILITHGTSTLVETASYLSAAKLDKTIVIFGAARPLGEVDSDASSNLGFALGVVSFLPAGVYVAMNGEVFPAGEVKKNFATGMFERKQLTEP